MKEQVVYCGIDVAKSHLDVALEQKRWRVTNTKSQISRLVSQLKALPALQVICEASGGYEQALVRALQQASVAVSLIQPQRVRQFARSAGMLAKTDRIDAEVLRKFGEALKPPTTPKQPEEVMRLRELDRQRGHLSRVLVAEQNRPGPANRSTTAPLNPSSHQSCEQTDRTHRSTHPKPDRPGSDSAH